MIDIFKSVVNGDSIILCIIPDNSSNDCSGFQLKIIFRTIMRIIIPTVDS